MGNVVSTRPKLDYLVFVQALLPQLMPYNFKVPQVAWFQLYLNKYHNSSESNGLTKTLLDSQFPHSSSKSVLLLS